MSEARKEVVRVRSNGVWLEGDLVIPPRSRGLVVFAHGSGSSRHSPRNRAVARVLESAGLATLLMDLLSQEEAAEEDAGAMRRFDVELLARRLTSSIQWLDGPEELHQRPIGYFGASTGAAAALIAAAESPERVGAVVSRGGRPDLAPPDVLARVEAPTLLLVGSRDVEVLELNRRAYEQLRCQRQLHIVPGATHLFEEKGALEQVAAQARDWFVRFLGARPTPPLHRGESR